jgi:hypothetical protein
LVRNLAVAILILHFAVIASVVTLPDAPQAYEGDSYSRYWKIANEINHGHGFSRDGIHQDSEEQPLYPVFIAVAYRFQRPRLVLVTMQATLGILTALLISRAAGLLQMDSRIALLIAALDPFITSFARRLLTETLATFICALLLYMGIRAICKPALLNDALVGALASTGILVRPDMALVAGLFCVSFVALRRSFRTAAISAVAAIVVLAPWTIRRYELTGAVRPLSNVTDQTHSNYVRWLSTWADKPQYVYDYWWSIAMGHKQPYPATELSLSERQNAEDAYERMVNGAGDRAFAELAVQPKPFVRSHIVVPITRVITTIGALPSLVSRRLSKAYATFFMMGIIVLSAIAVCRRMTTILLLPLAIVAGRLVLPAFSAVAMEPRYLLESLPGLFLLATAGIHFRQAKG